MAYYINGRRMDYSEAVVYLVNWAAGRIIYPMDKLAAMIRDFLFSIVPGTGREYQNLRISCAFPG